MQHKWRAWRWWISVGLALSLAGAVVLARTELVALKDAFETDARIVHRLLSQRVVQQDAVLATLSLLQSEAGHTSNATSEQRLPALYPQIVSVQRLEQGAQWPDTALAKAQSQSQVSHQPTLADADLAQARYRLVMAGHPVSHAMTFDAQAMVPRDDWPMSTGQSPVAVWLEHGGKRMVLQAGSRDAATETGSGWTFGFRKRLAADSQPFDVVARRHVGWDELPWPAIVAWTALVGVGMLAAAQIRRQRVGRQRAEELLRLGQVARLNTLGELAAGMAHELNQPLTAVLANTQAARRLLEENPPELDVARSAMQQAADQARRAADVLGRLRRSIEQPDLRRSTRSVNLSEVVGRAVHLLEPESAGRRARVSVDGLDRVWVVAEPVALDQILHNLLMNALQALEQVPADERQVRLNIGMNGNLVELRVADTGPGIPAENLPRLFQPFFTTREGGLGLGLSLSESLAQGMGGQLTVTPNKPRGAVFVLTLPVPEGRT